MGNVRKSTIFGYLDIFTSIAQLLATLISAPVSIYLYFKNKKRVSEDNSIDFTPILNFVFALLAIYATIRHIVATKKLMKAEKNVSIYSNTTLGQICISFKPKN